MRASERSELFKVPDVYVASSILVADTRGDHTLGELPHTSTGHVLEEYPGQLKYSTNMGRDPQPVCQGGPGGKSTWECLSTDSEALLKVFLT